jgi:Tol biopolymer transport system component
LVALAATWASAGCAAPTGPHPLANPTAVSPLPGSDGLPVTGKLLISRDGNFYSFDLSNRRENQLSRFPKSALAAAPALAPDRKSVAYTYYVVPTNANDLGGSDLYLMDVDGANMRLFQAHGQSGRTFQAPCWAMDGQTIFASLVTPSPVNGQATGTRSTIVRIPASGGAPTEIIEGSDPTLSPDGKLLAYLSSDSQVGTRLWVSNLDGSGARELLKNHPVGALQSPRFSPDSSRIAFAAAGSPVKARRPNAEFPFALLAPDIAEADGTPMDVWTIRVDRTDLRQLTATLDHNPFTAWSPDGKWIAEAGELSLTIVDANGTRAEPIANNMRATGIVWVA